jgi:hypothetical protein
MIIVYSVHVFVHMTSSLPALETTLLDANRASLRLPIVAASNERTSIKEEVLSKRQLH